MKDAKYGDRLELSDLLELEIETVERTTFGTMITVSDEEYKHTVLYSYDYPGFYYICRFEKYET